MRKEVMAVTIDFCVEMILDGRPLTQEQKDECKFAVADAIRPFLEQSKPAPAENQGMPLSHPGF